VAALTGRNLDDDVVRVLGIRVAEHGRSAEAEHQEILRQFLTGSHRPALRPPHAWPNSGAALLAAAPAPLPNSLRNPKRAGQGISPASRAPEVTLIVNASVALKWVLQESDSHLAQALAEVQRGSPDIGFPFAQCNEYLLASG
jgi:plasmid stability protein